MKSLYFATALGAAILALGGAANAQGTRAGSSESGTATNQCWDVSSNVVRDRSGTNATGPSGNAKSTVGSANSPGSSSTSTTGSGGTSANADAAVRPAGMPNC
jgi:hypothetical protein